MGKTMIWTVLKSWVHRFASAVGVFSLACGHWRGELVDGLCFDCALKAIEQRTWDLVALAVETARNGGWR